MQSYRPRFYGKVENGESGEDDLLRNWLETVTWRQRESALAESYRGTLASLMHCGGDAPHVIVFTSASASEGKTTTVTNLGIALAESGRKILLIDADRRRPHLHDIFKRPNGWGFSDFLLETTPVDLLDPARLFMATEVPGLFVLPGGSDRSCVPNLVGNSRAAELLELARQQFDAILIDTPPMLALSDARGLGRMADGVALVIRAERTPEHIVFAATERLRQDGTKVLGTILNNWNPSKEYGSSYYQRAAYGYKRPAG
jgi:receptor protein-tyrosine kinase